MKKCELLIPAGGMDQFMAAVENGADAVYLGGKEFNARINAGNFDREELVAIVDFAHVRGVKVYITMNTLIDDDEMSDAIDYVAFLYEIGVDALIIQDVGLAYVVKSNFEDLPIHFSTQGSIYNLEGAKISKKLGFERVVLARELSLEEIKIITRESGVETEVFVHGALCLCYSGQCQMSRANGKRSGNKGTCAQPCRMAYKTLDDENRLLSEAKYPLSTKDLCLIDHIGKLVSAGVSSLKIEGRMKSAEYVAVVTGIYRKYLDLYERDGDYIVNKSDRDALVQIFNRGGFTEGYFYENLGNELLAGDIPKHQGKVIGKVIKHVTGTALFDVKLYDELEIGDGVEINGKYRFGNIVTYLKPLKGGLTRIGDLKGRCEHGDKLYKISSKEQLKGARITYENKTLEQGKYKKKISLDMKLIAKKENELTLFVKGEGKDSTIKASVAGDAFAIEIAKNKATTVDDVKKQLGKTGNTPFVLKNLNVEMDENVVVPLSAINDLRRKALGKIESEIKRSYKRVGKEVKLNDCDALERNLEDELYFYSFKDFINKKSQLDLENASILLPVEECVENFQKLMEVKKENIKCKIVPYVMNIGKGKLDEFISRNFSKIVEVTEKLSGAIYVGNLGHINLFKDTGIKIYGDFGLNICNKYSGKVYKDLGICQYELSLETYPSEIGGYPLMISEHIVNGKSLIGQKNEKNIILTNYFDDKTIIIRINNEIRRTKDDGKRHYIVEI